MNFGKYLEGVGVQLNYANTNPTTRIPTSHRSVRRAGRHANVDRRERELRARLRSAEPAGQRQRGGDTAAAADFCGQISNLRFGQPVLTGNYDPDLLSGWGVRAADWSLGVSVQQQLLPAHVDRSRLLPAIVRRLHAERQPRARSRRPDAVQRHRAADSRLPNGGGYTIAGLYDVVPAKSGQVDNLATLANKYGEQYQYFNGVDVTLSLRTRAASRSRAARAPGRTSPTPATCEPTCPS